MRALICSAYGDPATLTMGEIAAPKPDGDEILIEVETVGLGYFDTVLLRGLYQEKPALPFIPGRECCGIVLKVGVGVDPNLIGKRVAGVSFTGALAEQATLKSGHFMQVPAQMSAAAAGSFISAYATMLYALENCGKLKKGEHVLVLGAAGTVGQAAIALTRALGGRSTAAASSPEKRAQSLTQGAETASDYTSAEWRAELRRIAPIGFDLIVDPVGGAYSETAFRHIAPGGRHLVLGFSSGEVPRLALNLPLLKRASVIGVDWGGFSQNEPEANAALLQRLYTLIDCRAINPEPSEIYPLEEVSAVISALQNRQMIGKPVIAIKPL